MGNAQKGLPQLDNPITAGGVIAMSLGPSSGAPALCFGSGAPSASFKPPQGSLYLRTDGGASTELYVARDNAGTWKAVTTAA